MNSKATAPKFKEPLERFVGGLLMAKADEGTGRLYLSMDKNRFKGGQISVSDRNFDAAVKALSALILLSRRGQAREQSSHGGRMPSAATRRWNALVVQLFSKAADACDA